MGYTGLAFIQQTVIDDWLVSRLTKALPPPGRSATPSTGLLIRGPVNDIMDIGSLINTLAALLTEAYSLLPGGIQRRWAETRLLVCGWQWKRRNNRSRPLLFVIRPSYQLPHFEIASKERHWWIGRDGPASLFAEPFPNLPPDFAAACVSHVQCTNELTATEDGMVALVRHVAETSPYVGRDVITVSLSPRSTARGRVRFFHDSHGATTSPFFTPWMIGPKNVYSPAVTGGHLLFEIGHYTLSAKASSVEEEKAFSAYARSSPPRGQQPPLDPIPPLTMCIVADHVATQGLAGFDLKGFHGIAPDVSIAVKQLPAQIELGFAFIGQVSKGSTHAINFELSRASDGVRSMPSPTARLSVPPYQPFRIALNTNLWYPKPDKYTLHLRIDRKIHYSAAFTVRQA